MRDDNLLFVYLDAKINFLTVTSLKMESQLRYVNYPVSIFKKTKTKDKK